MLENPHKRYTLKVKDIKNVVPDATMVVTANSISKAVELFLRDYLMNQRLTVEIVEQDYIERRI